MKKLAVLLMIFLTILLCSCGGGKKENKASQEPVQSKENLALETKEGMMQKLKEFNIEIPEILPFESISQKTILFSAKNTDDALKKQLDDYYAKICSGLKAAGWNESVDKENQDLGGIVTTTYRYKKPLVNKNFSEILIVSTQYFENSRNYNLGFTYYPQY
jgi:hypothetical protein